MGEVPDRLKAIIAYKHDEVAALKRARSMGSLLADAKAANAPRGFRRRPAPDREPATAMR